MAVARNDYGGGGIEITSAQKPPRIENIEFILCKSGNDGGALGIRSSPIHQETCVLSCCFVQCEINHTESSDGGSLLVWYSNAAIGCSNTLFLDNHSEQRGGAVSYHIYTSAGYHSSIHLFFFCFFRNNSARINPGNDVFFREWSPSQPFLHCFSLSAELRGYIYSSGTTQTSNWLPHGIIFYFVCIFITE